MKAKKHLGQHFLTDETLCENIANSLIVLDDIPRILEVGPGKGVLSKYLLQKDAKYQAVELDKDMVQYLINEYPNIEECLIQENVLHLDFSQLFDQKEFLLIGNYPYNISTEIIFQMLKHRDHIPQMVGMFQKEVADRIVAKHGSKIYGITSVLTQIYYEGETLFAVPPSSFSPPPKVQSSVIRLTRKESIPECNYKLLTQLVKISFNQRRKMLRNTLKSFIIDLELLNHKVFTLRPEHLSVENFIELTHLIENQNES